MVLRLVCRVLVQEQPAGRPDRTGDGNRARVARRVVAEPRPVVPLGLPRSGGGELSQPERGVPRGAGGAQGMILDVAQVWNLPRPITYRSPRSKQERIIDYTEEEEMTTTATDLMTA